LTSPLELDGVLHFFHTQQFSQLDLVANVNFDSYTASDGCSTATSTTVTATTTTITGTTTTTITGTTTTTTVTATTTTSRTVTSTTATQTSTTVGCVYDGPIVNQKGTNTFRIDILTEVSLSQCLAGCTANVDCNGVSYDVCDNFTFY
jgi:hypothetical protein